MQKEKTLVLLKPDCLQRGIVGEIITRFERVGLKIVGMKMASPDQDHFHKHYEGIGQVISRRGEMVFKEVLAFMQSGPVLAVVLEGVEAADLVRKIVGSTEPKAALPGTIRGDYSHISFSYANNAGKSTLNIVHASGNQDEAKLEIALWFTPEELFNYKLAHEHLIA
jgi:nucleoside-diphosphate kinase